MGKKLAPKKDKKIKAKMPKSKKIPVPKAFQVDADVVAGAGESDREIHLQLHECTEMKLEELAEQPKKSIKSIYDKLYESKYKVLALFDTAVVHAHQDEIPMPTEPDDAPELVSENDESLWPEDLSMPDPPVQTTDVSSLDLDSHIIYDANGSGYIEISADDLQSLGTVSGTISVDPGEGIQIGGFDFGSTIPDIPSELHPPQGEGEVPITTQQAVFILEFLGKFKDGNVWTALYNMTWPQYQMSEAVNLHSLTADDAYRVIVCIYEMTAEQKLHNLFGSKGGCKDLWNEPW